MHTEQKETSLQLAITLSLISLVISFITTVHVKYGIAKLPIITGHPEVLQAFIAQAVGGSVLLPAVHVAIISIFKSKRTPSTRRRVFIGWAVFIVGVNVFTLLMQQVRI